MDNPMIVAVAAPVVVAVLPPGAAVILYPVISEPPLLAGAVHLAVAEALPGTAVTLVGAPGAVTGALGVVAALATDAGEVPAALVEVTVNVYAVPLVSPVIVAVIAPVVVAVLPPGAAVIVYSMIREPPSLTGAVQDTAASALPAVAKTLVGATGTAIGVTAALAQEAADVPAGLVAVTVNVYAVPLVSPATAA